MASGPSYHRKSSTPHSPPAEPSATSSSPTCIHRPTYSPSRQTSQVGQESFANSDNGIDFSSHGRRSSLVDKLGAIGDVGGLNSFKNFARSWSRAAVFHEFSPPQQPSFDPDDSENQRLGHQCHTHDHEAQSQSRSLLRLAIEQQNQSAVPITNYAEDDQEESNNTADSLHRIRSQQTISPSASGLPQIEPEFASPIGKSYGSVDSRTGQETPRHARLPSGEFVPRASISEGQLLLPKHRDQPVESKDFKNVIGRSTLPQTVFNSVNTLIGVGMLSLPLALKYSGWIVGLIFFLFAAVTTSYTAKLLAKCLDFDSSLLTFSDLAYVSFGPRARMVTSVLFCLELLASCVALVVLFADSLNALIPVLGTTDFKLLCGLILVPLAFIPLSYLSFSSVLGIFCCLWIVTAIFVDGISKPAGFGSLRDPSKTYIFPTDWRTLPLAYGLLMAPWGGHSVFPNIYKDMRHPSMYNSAVNTTYMFTFNLEVALAITGYMMFGDWIRDEVTSNIFMTRGYPQWLSATMVVAIGIIPLTKCPLNARPIYSTIEILASLEGRTWDTYSSRRSPVMEQILRFMVRATVTWIFVAIAIFVPSFDKVMALVGSLACSLVCVIMPCCFHLRMFGKDLSRVRKLLDWALITAFMLLGLTGTIFLFLPKRWLGA